MKTCTKCGETKPLSEFYRRGDRPHGHRPQCKPCSQARSREASRRWAQNNQERTREAARKWRAANPERHKEINRRWQKDNPDLGAARAAKRHAQKLRATPTWANHDEIQRMYTLAKIEEARIGRKIHVDHIIPLQGKNVCGLHVAENLQLMFVEDNCAKSNKHEP